ncbi:membrane integrity-associated transporter subunit PqiC [Legionella lytica]|uniref:Membrane integrity-associated transporter subunit PqiC n=1 Tax=Legionella lytica TaxID=96232 RepID=A0ABY4YBW7_9GAMM|nr:ABC-type transport auxiliary lipoprotein family protein [Legionella lytica]USQ14873.1 membrane integrity-associated transporter subunit PqiC [Legionella lytica]
MRRLNNLGLCLIGLLLAACSPVKIPATNQYQLTAYSSKQLTRHPQRVALWVTQPDAAAGYQSEQMLYVNKPFQLESFVKNSWSNPPADMLYPLMVQSLQKTGVFHAVLSSSYSQGADYRLDTQLLSLEQSFLRKPSVLQFSAKVVLTRVSDNKVMGSKIISLQIPCPVDNPYGGVVAANQATRQFTSMMSEFVVSHL